MKTMSLASLQVLTKAEAVRNIINIWFPASRRSHGQL